MKKILLSFIALAIMVSCLKDSGDSTTPPEQYNEYTLMAGIATKTVLSDADKVLWENGDQIAAVFTKKDGTPYVGIMDSEIEGDVPVASTTFIGHFPQDVNSEDCEDFCYAVYPETAVQADGTVSFTLPSEQTPRENGSFAAKYNLSSAVMSLSELEKDRNDVTKAAVIFRNSPSILRIALSEDVTSVTVTGTSPLTGTAPLKMFFDEEDPASLDNGRLLVDADGMWNNESNSVVLKSPNGNKFGNATYNVLIWPGDHSSISLSLKLVGHGDYTKTLHFNKAQSFKPAKYYNLKINNTEELVIEEISGMMDNVEGEKDNLDSSVSEEITKLLKQIQSLTLMTEYLDNAAYAPYAHYTNSIDKQDISLEYRVRPKDAAKSLVDLINDESNTLTAADVLSGVVYFRDSEGNIDYSKEPAVLSARSVSIDDGLMTVTLNASGLSDNFYKGSELAEMTLHIDDSVAGGSTDLTSDIAKLYPMSSSGIRGNYIENIQVPVGVEVSVPFSYTVAASEYEITAVGTNVTGVSVSYNRDYKTGYLNVGISGSTAVADQSVVVKITSGETELATKTFTFQEAGELAVISDGPADYIGGDVVVTVERNDFAAGTLTIHNANGTGVSQNGMVFSFGSNAGSSQRTATAKYSIKNGSLTYNKYIDIVQYGTSTSLQREYYSNGQRVMLNKANGNYFALNIVILGDGFTMKDLSEGGKYERAARSAISTLFSIEPFKSFQNRFNVYMVAHKSNEEGTDITSADVYKDTYFNSSFVGGGNTAATSDKDKIVTVVKNSVGLSSDAAFYRTVVMLLVNTDENAGSCDYPSQTTIGTGTVGDGYASFSIATLAAFSTGTNGLIKHELGGHAFGRLGDEYSQSWYTADIINQRHNVGFYRNIATSKSYWSAFTAAGYSADEVGYHLYDGKSGMWRSTYNSGMMWNTNGNFNAVSRWAIYDRIRKQSEGNADYWNDFLDWDRKNR